MDFKINEGFRVEGTTASVNLADLADDELNAVRQELDTVAESRGLWIPAGAGSLAVATEVEAPSMRDQLLTSVEQSASLYRGAISDINASRKTKDQIPLLKTGEYRERAEDWLTGGRLAAAKQLPISKTRPRLLVPRLNHAVTTEEIVDAWKSAASGNLYSWSGRMKFLANWTANQLSGFDPELEDQVLFEVLPAAYDKAREGTVKEQKVELETLQTDYPELDAATIFDGAVLARRYLNQPRRWQDSYVRGITLDPAEVDGVGYVPGAYVSGGGDAYVSGSCVDLDVASRLQVR